MRYTLRRSFGFAFTGIKHAWKKERNLRLFAKCYVLVIGAGLFLRLLTWEWIAVLGAGFGFITVELLNTAIERLTDALDANRKLDGTTGFHPLLKATKDVAAGASLVCLILVMAILSLVFWPYARIIVGTLLR